MIERWSLLPFVRTVAAILFAACLGGAALAQAPAADPPTTPFLRIDPGFHTQVINRIAVDRSGRIVASVSDDKTIRIWSAADGAPLATLRVPIADGDEGALYAVALSPDGKTLLAAGHTGIAWDRAVAIYLFDLEKQRIRGRLPNLPAPVNHLAFAPDGKSFAMALGGKSGVRIIDATNGKTIAQDEEFQDRATWVAYDRAGRLAAVGFDGQVRLYDATGKRIARRAPAGGGKPYSVAFSPDGETIAVGYGDQARVELLGGRDLAARSTLRGNEPGGLGAVAFGADGTIFAAGSVRGRDGGTLIRRWAAGGKGAPTDWPATRDTVFQIEAIGTGGLMVAGAGPALLRLDPSGAAVYKKAGLGLDFRDISDRRFAVSADGMEVEVQGVGMTAPFRINLADRTVTGDAVPPLPYTRALTAVAAPPTNSQPAATPAAPAAGLAAAAPLQVSDWRNTTQPKVNNRPVALDAEELARSHAVTPNRRFALIGTDYHLRVVGADGKPASTARVPAAVWGVATSADGATVVAALGDGTLRWYGIDAAGALTERVTLFLAADGNRWIAWTGEGFFDHAELGGKELVGYQLNRGKAQAPDWFSFAQVYRLFYAPDLVAQRMKGQGAAEARKRLADIGDLRRRLDQGGPPQIELVAACWQQDGKETCRDLSTSGVSRAVGSIATTTSAPNIDVTLPTGVQTMELRYKLVDRGGSVGPVDVFLNSRNVGRSRGAGGGPGEVRSQLVPTEAGLSKVQLRAYDGAGIAYSQSAPVRVAAPEEPDPVPETTNGTVAQTDMSKPKLYLLAVGINKYKTGINSLNFAVPDAKSFADMVKARSKSIYRDIEAIELYDDDASASRVVKAFERIGTMAQSNDTVLIYLSGHGTITDQRYYFITQNVTGVPTIQQEAFSETMLVRGLSGIRAKNGMVFIDTCHAGAFSLDSASQLAHESGRYVLAAASSVEEALDSYDNQNGVFATAVIRGLKGAAARGSDKTINNFDLGLFVSPLVKKLAEEKQHSQSARFKIAAEDAQPFPIALLETAER